MSGRRVFVGRLSYRAREGDVERFFKGFGRINEISMKAGFCFVEFDDIRDAEDAVYEMNNKTLCGERVTVEHAKGNPRSRTGGYGGGGGGGGGGYDRFDRGRDYNRDYRDRSRDYNNRNSSKFAPPTRTDYRVIVENLSSRVSWQDLKDYLRDAGEITFADAHTHRRNEGVVDFATYDDMKRAIDKLNNSELKGRKIRLVEDKPSKSYSRSRSRSESRSRSRSRGRSHSGGSRSRSRSRSRSGSKSDHRSRSRSPKRSRSKSRSINGEAEEKSDRESPSKSEEKPEEQQSEEVEKPETDDNN